MWYLGPDPDFGEMSAVHSDQLSLYERGSSFPTSIRGHLNVVNREREPRLVDRRVPFLIDPNSYALRRKRQLGSPQGINR
jgi:hypothetical protein